MKYQELIKGFKLWKVGVKVDMPAYSQVIDTTVIAKNREMARRLVLKQFGKKSIIRTITEIK
jgi:hypothetical protein